MVAARAKWNGIPLQSCSPGFESQVQLFVSTYNTRQKLYIKLGKM